MWCIKFDPGPSKTLDSRHGKVRGYLAAFSCVLLFLFYKLRDLAFFVPSLCSTLFSRNNTPFRVLRFCPNYEPRFYCQCAPISRYGIASFFCLTFGRHSLVAMVFPGPYAS